MSSKKHLEPNKKKTLKNKITQYIYKKKNICCEDDIDRKIVIQDIFKFYREIAEFMYQKNEYLSYIDNDIVKFIGYKIYLEKEKNKDGVKLWNEIDAETRVNKKLNKAKIIELLNKVPLYYLLSFLGYAYYRYKRLKDILDNIEDNIKNKKIKK